MEILVALGIVLMVVSMLCRLLWCMIRPKKRSTSTDIDMEPLPDYPDYPSVGSMYGLSSVSIGLGQSLPNLAI